MRHVIFILLVVQTFAAAATSISSQTSFGPQSVSEMLDGSGDFNDDWDWGAGVSTDRSESTVDGTKVTDVTRGAHGGAGWFNGVAGVRGNVTGSATPSENLSNTGATLDVRYRWKTAPDEAKFHSYFQAAIVGGTTNYRIQFSGTALGRNGKVRPVSGQRLLNQTSLGLDLKWRPVKIWSLRASVTSYKYNKDVADFQTQLDSPAAARRGLSGFAGTVGGLPGSTATVGLNFYLADWTIYLSECLSQLAVDHSRSHSSKINVEYDVNDHWLVSAGFEYDKSSTYSDSMGLIGVEWTM
jgi:hypothetical protein